MIQKRREHRILLSGLLLMSLILACICPASAFPIRVATITPSPPEVTQAPPVTGLAAPFNIDWNDRSLFQMNLSSTYQNILSGLPYASIYHIAFNLSDPPEQINGLEEVRYTNAENVNLSEVDFAVFPEILGGTITINDFQLDGQKIPVTHKNGIMRVPLRKTLQPGKSIVFHIEFTVTVPTQGGSYYYGIFGYNDSILSLAQAYPTILVYNEQGWNNKTPDLSGDPLFSDISFYLVSVDAPKNLTLVASGVEVQRSATSTRQQMLFADGPARDFYLAASSDFHKVTEKAGEWTVNSYTTTPLDAYAQDALKDAEAALQDYSRRYAPYPYTEFDVAPIQTSAGGVEYPGMTVISEDVYTNSQYLDGVIAHEVGHQWFYNLVGNETQNQPWLDEALAQFLSWQYFLDDHGSQAAQSLLSEFQGNWDSIKDKPIPIGEAVSAYTSQEYVAIVYGRGPLFIMALRQQMGIPAFDRFMSDYVHALAWQVSTTDTFEQLAAKDCGCNLMPLFKQWVTP